MDKSKGLIMEIDSLLKQFNKETIDSFTKIEVEYNECGGYLAAYDIEDNEYSIVSGGDSDNVYNIADDLAEYLKVPLIY